MRDKIRLGHQPGVQSAASTFILKGMKVLLPLLATALVAGCTAQSSAPPIVPVAAPSQPVPAPQREQATTTSEETSAPPAEPAESLNKNLIRRTIRRKLPAIRHCYELELLVEPTLQGTVVTQFSIALDGTVGQISVTGMKPEVADCVGKVVAGIVFAKPSGDKDLQVRYPFTFAPAGQQPPRDAAKVSLGYRANLHVVSVTGGLQRPAVERVFALAQSHFEQCGGSGKSERRLEVLVAATGKPEKVTVEGSVLGVAQCVKTIVEDLRFMQSAKDTSVVISLTLTPRQAGGLGLRHRDNRHKASTRGTARLPSVRTGDLAAVGNLDKNVIRRYFRRKLPRIRHCYERELLLLPDLQGSVVVEFTIGVDGTATQVEVDGINERMSACIRKAIGTLRFPKPRGGGVVKVRYPLGFIFAG